MTQLHMSSKRFQILLALAILVFALSLLWFWMQPRESGVLQTRTDNRETNDALVARLPESRVKEPQQEESNRADSAAEKRRFFEAADRSAHFGILERLVGDLIVDLHLTDQERLQFMGHLVEARRSALDAIRVGRSTSQPENDAFAKLVRDAAVSQDGELLALLGDDRFKVFSEYRHNLEEQTTVRLLQEKLDEIGSVLTPAQVDALMRIGARDKSARSYYPETAAFLQTTGIYLNSDVVDAMSPILTDAQAAALRQLHAEQVGNLEMQKEYAQKMRAKQAR